jgi:hypothetical protein
LSATIRQKKFFFFSIFVSAPKFWQVGSHIVGNPSLTFSFNK